MKALVSQSKSTSTDIIDDSTLRTQQRLQYQKASMKKLRPLLLQFKTYGTPIKSLPLLSAQLTEIAADVGLQSYESPGMEDDSNTVITICGNIFVIDVYCANQD